MKTPSSLYQLDPFLDSHDILRLGGRITGADVPYDLKHLVILAKKSHITELISRHYYHQVEHQGQGITLKSFNQVGTGSLKAPLLLETSSQNALSVRTWLACLKDWNYLPLSHIVR